MAAPQGINFGTPYLTRGADLTGNADSKLVSGSFWFRYAASPSDGWLYSSDDGAFTQGITIQSGSSGQLVIGGYDSGGTIRLNVSASNVSDTDWHHCMFSFDMSDTGKRHLYIDDASDLNVTTYTDATLDFTKTDHNVGDRFITGLGAFGQNYNGDLADFWLDFGTYIDLSVEANRRKFVGASAASSVDLGSDGSNPTGSAPIVFFSGAVSTWHTNDGTGGGFTENGALTAASANPPDYAASSITASGTLEAQAATVSGSASITGRVASGALQAGSAAIDGAAIRAALASGTPQAQAATLGGASGYEAQGVNFDGSTTYLTRGADLTGNADGKLVTGSLWFKCTGTSNIIYQTERFDFQISAGTVYIQGRNAAGTEIIEILSATSTYNDGAFHHVMFSFDLADTGKRHLYVDDADDISVSAYTNDTWDFTQTEHYIGSTTNTFTKFNGDLADVYINLAEYVDLSIEANRRKFIDASGNAVDLGSDGSTPTGTAPIMFFSGATSTWHTNDGTGGGFTENGTLTDASTNPPAGAGSATAVVTRKASGAPQAQAAAISGEATLFRILTAEGALAAQAASTTGAASRTAKASGTPAAQDASTTGAASRTAKASGTPAAQDASIVGAATIFVQGIATGALQAGAAAISGAASKTAKASGALESGAAAVSGAAELVHKASGAIASGAASIAGAAVRTAKASGTLASQAATIIGRMVINIVRPNFGVSATMTDAAVARAATMTDEKAVSGTMSDDPVAVETEIAP